MEAGADTLQKALRINLDPRWYGTFAEIGAGQEVVRWFFRVGGAAGTIAKSMSAYDMTVSDAIYGKADRYVSRAGCRRCSTTSTSCNMRAARRRRAATTPRSSPSPTPWSARNFKGTNECHGWMGVKFQAHPRDEASQIIIHVRMLDTENVAAAGGARRSSASTCSTARSSCTTSRSC